MVIDRRMGVHSSSDGRSDDIQGTRARHINAARVSGGGSGRHAARGDNRIDDVQARVGISVLNGANGRNAAGNAGGVAASEHRAAIEGYRVHVSVSRDEENGVTEGRGRKGHGSRGDRAIPENRV